MEPTKDLRNTINEAMLLRNYSREKLAQITGIAEHHLISLENLDFKKLPAAPYVRGYLKKISLVLGLNFEELWKIYEKEMNHKMSGIHDQMPKNRFAIQSINKGIIAGGLLLLALLIYLGVNARSFFGTPELEIFHPESAINYSTESAIELSGKINPKDKLTINGEETPNDPEGNFQKIYNLQPGLNMIEFKVKRILGKETIVTRQVIYQVEDNLATTTP